MDDRLFIDTNVLVYANWSGAARHTEARARLQQLAGAGGACWISRQILREFLVVVTRPQGEVTPMSVAEAVATVQAFQLLFTVADETADTVSRLLDLVARYAVRGRVIHDANIVATMLTFGVRRLLTANPSDFRRFADLIDIEPL